MNTKKKLIALALAFVCLSAIAVGGTMAAVTEEGTAHNVITSSAVDIELKEWQLVDGEKVEYPDQPITGVMPNTTHSKIVEVHNKELTEAWVRVKVVKTIQLAEGVTGQPDVDLIELDINTEHWTEKDGYYYYNTKLLPGEKTEPLFKEVAFAAGMGNMYQESTATVKVVAEAVQAANNPTAQGWPNT